MMMMMCKRTRTGPYAVRADIQHEVSHDAKKNSHFYHVFSTYEDGRRQARANRGVCPYSYHIMTIKNPSCYRTPRSSSWAPARQPLGFPRCPKQRTRRRQSHATWGFCKALFTYHVDSYLSIYLFIYLSIYLSIYSI